MTIVACEYGNDNNRIIIGDFPVYPKRSGTRAMIWVFGYPYFYSVFLRVP